MAGRMKITHPGDVPVVLIGKTGLSMRQIAAALVLLHSASGNPKQLDMLESLMADILEKQSEGAGKTPEQFAALRSNLHLAIAELMVLIHGDSGGRA